MGRFILKSLPSHQRIQIIAEFYDAVATLKSRQNVRRFFHTLLSPSEITMLMRRIEIALLLYGGYTHRSIRTMTGMGMATIFRIDKKIKKEGKVCGYRIVIKHLLEIRKRRIQKTIEYEKAAREQPFKSLKRRYPSYHLLQRLIDEIDARAERKSKEFTIRALRHTPSRK